MNSMFFVGKFFLTEYTKLQKPSLIFPFLSLVNQCDLHRYIISFVYCEFPTLTRLFRWSRAASFPFSIYSGYSSNRLKACLVGWLVSERPRQQLGSLVNGSQD